MSLRSGKQQKLVYVFRMSSLLYEHLPVISNWQLKSCSLQSCCFDFNISCLERAYRSKCVWHFLIFHHFHFRNAILFLFLCGKCGSKVETSMCACKYVCMYIWMNAFMNLLMNECMYASTYVYLHVSCSAAYKLIFRYCPSMQFSWIQVCESFTIYVLL